MAQKVLMENHRRALHGAVFLFYDFWAASEVMYKAFAACCYAKAAVLIAFDQALPYGSFDRALNVLVEEFRVDEFLGHGTESATGRACCQKDA